MHHFPTREGLLVEAVSELALRMADNALEEVNLVDLRKPARREAVLDQVWREFTSPQALAAAQLWYAAGAEPELAAALRDLEDRLGSVLMAAGAALFPEQDDEPGFAALVDTGLSLIRGLVMAIPVSGRDAVEERWNKIRPILARAVGDLLDARTAARHAARHAA